MFVNLIVNLFLVSILGQSAYAQEIILPEILPIEEPVEITEEATEAEPIQEAVKTPERINLASRSLGVKITAKSALVIDQKTGKILYQYNDGEILSIASITKLMTTLVFLENNPGWEKEIVFSEEDKTEGSTDYLYSGESVKIRDLFYLSLMMSNNSATSALVHSTGLGRSEFVNLMNKKASEFGMSDTNFVDIIGLEDFNVSTARDVAKLASVAFSNPDIKDATTTGRYTVHTINTNRHFYIYNTNYLLGSFLNEGEYRITGGKTGYINASGYCLTTEIKKEEAGNIISVVLGSNSLENRFQDTKALVHWVFSNYEWR